MRRTKNLRELVFFFNQRADELEDILGHLKKGNYYINKNRILELIEKTIELNRHLAYYTLEALDGKKKPKEMPIWN